MVEGRLKMNKKDINIQGVMDNIIGNGHHY